MATGIAGDNAVYPLKRESIKEFFMLGLELYPVLDHGGLSKYDPMKTFTDMPLKAAAFMDTLSRPQIAIVADANLTLDEKFKRLSGIYPNSDLEASILDMMKEGLDIDSAPKLSEIFAAYDDNVKAIKAEGGPQMHEKLLEANLMVAAQTLGTAFVENMQESLINTIVKPGADPEDDYQEKEAVASALTMAYLSIKVAEQNGVDINKALKPIMDKLQAQFPGSSALGSGLPELLKPPSTLVVPEQNPSGNAPAQPSAPPVPVVPEAEPGSPSLIQTGQTGATIHIVHNGEESHMARNNQMISACGVGESNYFAAAVDNSINIKAPKLDTKTPGLSLNSDLAIG